MLQKYPAISLWKRVKKIFEGHNFFSNITINHKLISFIVRKYHPKSNPKRRTATKRSNRSAAFDYNILLYFIRVFRVCQSIPSFRTLRRKDIKTQHEHPSSLYHPQLHFTNLRDLLLRPWRFPDQRNIHRGDALQKPQDIVDIRKNMRSHRTGRRG